MEITKVVKPERNFPPIGAVLHCLVKLALSDGVID